MIKIIDIIQLKKFYKAFKPNYIGAFKFYKSSVDFSQTPFKQIYVKDIEDFLDFMKKYEKYTLYSCYRPLKPYSPDRNEQKVEFHEYFFIDIDDPGDVGNFENLLTNNGLKYKYKVMSGRGYHYYIPTIPFTIVEKNELEKLKIVSMTFRDWLVDNNIKIDIKIVDLARYTRPWGTMNYKWGKLCNLIEEKELMFDDIQRNQDFIFNLKPKNVEVYKSPHTKTTYCDFIEYCINNNLKKEGVMKNDVLFKNAAAYLRTNGRNKNEARLLAMMQNHNESEIFGWWNKEDMNFNCFELYKYVKNFFPELAPNLCNKCLLNNKNSILYIDDDTQSYKQLKDNYRDFSRFPINKYYKLRGTTSISRDWKLPLRLIEKYTTTKKGEINFEDVEPINVYLDEVPLQKQSKMECIGNVEANFYVYDFIMEDNSYKLLSEVPIDNGEMIVEGSIVKIGDTTKLGDDRKVKSSLYLFFAHTVRSIIVKYKNWIELIDDFKYDEEGFEKVIFHRSINEREHYILNYPPMFKKLIKAFLFSGKLGGYPLHLVLNGVPGCGKSYLTLSLCDLYGKDMIAADKSTIKSFIPASPNGKYMKGHLYDADLFLGVDELFKLFINTWDRDKSSELLQTFNSSLENLPAIGGSSFCSRKEELKCKTLWNTNPVDIRNVGFIDSINAFPLSAIQRFLFFYMGDDFVNYLKEHPLEKIKEPIRFSKNKWLSLMEFMLSDDSTINYDEQRLRKIIEQAKDKVPSEIAQIYEVRMITHHAPLLFEGMVKWRILFEKDKRLKVKDSDYEEFEELWGYVINSWNGRGVSLSANEKHVIRLIPDDGILKQTLVNNLKKIFNFEEDRIEEILKNLRKGYMIKNGDKDKMQHTKIYKIKEREVKIDDFINNSSDEEL